MANTDQWHYTDKSGQQAGPIPTDELLTLIASKTVPTSAMAWKNGMANWQTVSQIAELSVEAPKSAPALTPAPAPAAPTPPETPVKQEEKANPYQTPESAKQLDDVPEIALSYDEMHGNGYGGIGRLAYFVWNLILGVLFYAVFFTVGFAAASTEQMAPVFATGVLALCGGYLLISLILVGKRLKNTGCSAWLALLSFIPLANIWVSVRCLCAPEGYSHTKKLDTAGIILFCLFVLFPIVLFVIVAIAGAFMAPAAS